MNRRSPSATRCASSSQRRSRSSRQPVRASCAKADGPPTGCRLRCKPPADANEQEPDRTAHMAARDGPLVPVAMQLREPVVGVFGADLLFVHLASPSRGKVSRSRSKSLQDNILDVKKRVLKNS